MAYLLTNLVNGNISVGRYTFVKNEIKSILNPSEELLNAVNKGLLSIDTAYTVVSGDSAYKIALKNGFIGTEPEWLLSLKGPQGPKGESGSGGSTAGPAGPKGDTGSQGVQGIQGIKGDKGDTGSQGAQGNEGPIGSKGDTGNTGLQGSQGIQGLKGDTGAQGIQGLQGATGLKGDKGDTGNTGPKGDTGPTTVSEGTNRTTTVSSTAILTDSNALITANSTSAIVITIPPESSVAWAPNAFLSVYQAGTGNISFAAGSGVTIRTASNIAASSQYGIIAAYKVSTNEWTLV